ncbi:hypothetical protein NSI01_13650 [Pimelobacter simplex]|nr:hypothetical protein NSI01_13650 [Pimelobacter simplex]
MLGEELLEVLLDAVLLQARVDAEVVLGVVVDLLDEDPQGVGGGALGGLGGDGPLDVALVGAALADGAGGATSS